MYQLYFNLNGVKGTEEFGTMAEAVAELAVLAAAGSPYYLVIIFEGTTVLEVSG